MRTVTAVHPRLPAGPSVHDRALRVAVLSDSPPARNGVGSYYADLVAQLRARGAHMELHCPPGEATRLHRYLLPPLPGDHTQRLWLPRPLRVARSLRSLCPHVIVVATPGPYGLLGMLLARRLGVPLIVGFHTSYENLASLYWNPLLGFLSRRLLETCNRALFRRSALTLANSAEMEASAKRLGASRTALMGTSVPQPLLSHPLAPLSSPMRRVVFVGRLAEEKNLPALIDAAEQHQDLTFTVAGDGPLRGFIERAARSVPNLHYAGWIAREDLGGFLDRQDLLVLPSHVESFGTVALEAMARGRLVLVSEACGIASWPELRDGLFSLAAGEDLASGIARLRALPEAARQRTAQRAHHAAASLNGWNLRCWLSWLGEVGERRGRRP